MSWVDVLRKLKKKLQFGTAGAGSGTPVGLGVPLGLLSMVIPKPCFILIYIDVSNYVLADSAEITITGQVAGPAIIIGRIDVAAGIITRVVGTPFFATGAGVTCSDTQALQFIYYTDDVMNFTVTVNQSVGPGLKQVNYRYNLLS